MVVLVEVVEVELGTVFTGVGVRRDVFDMIEVEDWLPCEAMLPLVLVGVIDLL